MRVGIGMAIEYIIIDTRFPESDHLSIQLEFCSHLVTPAPIGWTLGRIIDALVQAVHVRPFSALQLPDRIASMAESVIKCQLHAGAKRIINCGSIPKL